MEDVSTISNLLIKCENYLNGNNIYTPKEIIEEATDILAGVVGLMQIWEKCVFHINNWENKMIEEQCEDADSLVEELSGYIAEWLE